ncbi:RNA methyltransferase [Brevundimonas sp.]|uniref:TrmH family RNA methyltransferase n=1 Tax=Brevundimonas sp. TaxID=1871086 RepID=UPI002AB81035|nr:RNA methyltransferase [Brevundimonas sp.]MDZ4362237.1 RNA methyltransferase [Brevundimonas sp.]
MNPIVIEDPADPRIAAYRDIRERDLTRRDGRFVAEGEVVLNVLTSAASLCLPISVLVDSRRVEGLQPVLSRLEPNVPVHVASQDVLDAIAGFHLHRGILAMGAKPDAIDAEAFLSSLSARSTVVVACGIGNHDNMGGIFRSAAAFGAAGVILDDRCCDPFYRKAIRVSVGAVLRTPILALGSADRIVDRLLSQGVDVVAMTPSAEEPLDRAVRRGPTAIVLGSEGPGLQASVIARCRAVGIAMSGGFDSLNVATAGAIALHHFTRG